MHDRNIQKKTTCESGPNSLKKGSSFEGFRSNRKSSKDDYNYKENYHDNYFENRQDLAILHDLKIYIYSLKQIDKLSIIKISGHS